MVAATEIALLNRHLRNRTRRSSRSRSTRGRRVRHQRILRGLSRLSRRRSARRGNHRLNFALCHRLRTEVQSVLALKQQVAITHNRRLSARQSIRSRWVHIPGTLLHTRKNRSRQGIHLRASLRRQLNTGRERIRATGLHQIIHSRRKISNRLMKTRHRIQRKSVSHLRLRSITRRMVHRALLIIHRTLIVGVLHQTRIVLTIIAVPIRVSARLRTVQATTLRTRLLARSTRTASAQQRRRTGNSRNAHTQAHQGAARERLRKRRHKRKTLNPGKLVTTRVKQIMP